MEVEEVVVAPRAADHLHQRLRPLEEEEPPLEEVEVAHPRPLEGLLEDRQKVVDLEEEGARPHPLEDQEVASVD